MTTSEITNYGLVEGVEMAMIRNGAMIEVSYIDTPETDVAIITDTGLDLDDLDHPTNAVPSNEFEIEVLNVSSGIQDPTMLTQTQTIESSQIKRIIYNSDNFCKLLEDLGRNA